MTRPKTSRYTFGLLTTVSKDIFRSRYHAEILSGIFHRIGSLGHALKIFTLSDEPCLSLERMLQRYDLDGLLILTWRWIRPDFAELIETTRHERVLVFNDPVPGLQCNILYTDVEAGMAQAVEHLAKRGYRKIGMLHGPRDVIFKDKGKKIKSPFIDTHLKTEGFLRAMKAHRFQVRGSWIRETMANTEPEGYRVMRRWLREKKLPEAMICGNDDLALGVLEALKEFGKAVPRDLAVVGFDDNDHAKNSRPLLTTIRQPLFQMAQDAINILIKRIERPELAPATQKYPPKLIVRKTT
ncbi:MAG TPA: substrate-binding domain-containing protein [Candidatus Omnitrophota bacterium]|nr:substrate-binding domain-containing protein [Candidatus Omnitrophota bacterium]